MDPFLSHLATPYKCLLWVKIIDESNHPIFKNVPLDPYYI
jgi:hypothetical protein